MYLHQQINQQWHMHCLISWRNCPMSHDRSLLPSTLYSWCPCARQRWVTSVGCTGMMGILSISQIRLIFLTPRSFYLLLTSVFPLTCLPFTFPLSSSHPHCSSSPQFPFIPTSRWLPLPPTTFMPFLETSVSLPPPWSAHLPPCQPGFVPFSFPTHRVLAPGGLV